MSTPARRAGSRPVRWILVIAVLEIINASYLAAFNSATIVYHVNVVLHVVLGVPLAAAILLRSVPALLKGARRSGGPQGLLLRVLAATAIVFVGSGLILTYTGTARPYYALLRLHVASAVLGGLLLLALVWAWARRPAAGPKDASVLRWNMAVLVGAALFPLAAHGYRAAFPSHVSTIVNPPSPPLSAAQEGGGEANPFFPSSNETVGNKLLPSDFFLDSRSACGNKTCHPDITAQWESSMHHFSSFNNQWYRKSIEYMQDTIGTKPSKWCGGCHDMAILLTGRMDTPIREQIDTPEAQAGIGCLVCHSIVHVKDTMGQGGFVLEYPEMHRLAASKSPFMKLLHDYMTRLDPAPHRATMMKPFHRESTPQFCSSCHKVHLDEPVNSYRWFRGFNEYDPWQQSGVSGEGARSFYYPPESKTCARCHMPLVPSDDAGNIDGMVHSHRFPGANTAVPFVNGDAEQLAVTEKFLKENSVSVDIFGVVELAAQAPAGAPGSPREAAAEPETPAAASLFAGEEGVSGAAGEALLPAGRRLVAPLPRSSTAAPVPLERGRDYLVEVVTRTRNVGHMFPGGTVDAFDVWVELKGEDENGKVVFWSGWVEQEQGGRKGPVDPAAHFYRSFLLDAHGNHINKRNAWSARAMLYARLIPPGAADTTHFRVSIPEDCGDRLTFTAKVNYRKFSWWNTQWAYAGVRDPSDVDPAVTEHYDDGRWVFTGDTSGVSGGLKQIPDLPIVEVAADVRSFAAVDPGQAPPADIEMKEEDRAVARERFNDYGIGLLLQRDLKGAVEAFRTVTEIDPRYADGFVNVARAQIEEGNHRAAHETLQKALEIDPALPKTHYFYALTLKTFGRYDEAVEHLRTTLQSFPRDRVVLNQLGRVLFLQRKYEEAIGAFQRVLAIDPEDLQAHYNLMLCYRGKGDLESAKREEALYARFKADESAQEITGPRRLQHPEDNNERQLIHEHRSTWKDPAAGRAAGYAGQ
ncbi:MAG TPA: tetratricopeptide repeat protein [Candidatus Polarisedimenticolia bacterium]|nr:tetratricopeptide repeat protein [Candidatus Polarisedimenticolia bacterium]